MTPELGDDKTGDGTVLDSHLDLLTETLEYARDREYTGWDYGDGMSSRVLQSLPLESKWLNIAVQETIKRAPINLRPLFRVEQRRNLKGAALFAMANLTAHELTGQAEYRRDGRDLIDWLLDSYPKGYNGFCCTHPHDLQTLDGVVTAGTPGVVGTAYGVKALLRAAKRFEKSYADTARTAADFVLDDLDYTETGESAKINYKTTDDGKYYTLNANALGARLLIDLYDRSNDPTLKDCSTKILNYVARKQTSEGGWYYRDPRSASHLSMDNHHNGFIIECFQRYRTVTGSRKYNDVLESALDFYRGTLFESTGAPNFDEANAFPRDIHAATQGVLVFTYAGDHQFADRIIDWTHENMYAGNGGYYSRKQSFYTNRHVLMRWCVAWMAYALSESLRVRQ